MFKYLIPFFLFCGVSFGQLPSDLAYTPAFSNEQELINTHGVKLDDNRSSVYMEYEVFSSVPSSYLTEPVEIITTFSNFLINTPPLGDPETGYFIYPRYYALRYDTPSGTETVLAWDTRTNPPQFGQDAVVRSFSNYKQHANYVFRVDLSGEQASNIRFVVGGDSYGYLRLPRPLPVRIANGKIHVTRVSEMTYLNEFPYWFSSITSPVSNPNSQCYRYGTQPRLPSIACTVGNSTEAVFYGSNDTSPVLPVSKVLNFSRGALSSTQTGHYINCYGYRNITVAGKVAGLKSTAYMFYNMIAHLRIYDPATGMQQIVPFQVFNRGGEIDFLIESLDLTTVQLEQFSDFSVILTSFIPNGQSWAGQALFWLSDNEDPTLAGINDLYLPAWWVNPGDSVPPEYVVYDEVLISSLTKTFLVEENPIPGETYEMFATDTHDGGQCSIFEDYVDFGVFVEVLYQIVPPLLGSDTVTEVHRIGGIEFVNDEFAYQPVEVDDVLITRKSYGGGTFTVPEPATLPYSYPLVGVNFVPLSITRIWVKVDKTPDFVYYVPLRVSLQTRQVSPAPGRQQIERDRMTRAPVSR